MRAATTKAEGKRVDEIDRMMHDRAVDDLRAVMGAPEGRRFMWALLGECGLFRSSYHPSALIHYNEGQRSIGLALLARLNDHCPDQYLTMQGEAIDDQRKQAERMAVDNPNEDAHNDD